MAYPKKSLKQHLLDGTYREDRHGPVPEHLRHLKKPRLSNAGGPTKESLKPKFSPELLHQMGSPGPLVKPPGLSEQASAIWDHVVSTRGDSLSASDGLTLLMLCEWWVVWQQARATVEAADPMEIQRVLPSMKTSTEVFLSLARSFGLTPMDRLKVGGGERQEVSARVESRPKTKLDAMPLKIAEA